MADQPQPTVRTNLAEVAPKMFRPTGVRRNPPKAFKHPPLSDALPATPYPRLSRFRSPPRLAVSWFLPTADGLRRTHGPPARRANAPVVQSQLGGRFVNGVVARPQKRIGTVTSSSTARAPGSGWRPRPVPPPRGGVDRRIVRHQVPDSRRPRMRTAERRRPSPTPASG